MSEDDKTQDPSPSPDSRTFSFHLSLGKRPPVDAHGETFSAEFVDGKLRLGKGEPDDAPQGEKTADPRATEAWERLERIAEGRGAYPDTARWHGWLNIVVWVIAIALPVAALVWTIIRGESPETVFFMTFAAALVAAMFRASVR
jgi:hypothetical protein